MFSYFRMAIPSRQAENGRGTCSTGGEPATVDLMGQTLGLSGENDAIHHWMFFFPKTSENAIFHDLTTPRRQFNK